METCYYTTQSKENFDRNDLLTMIDTSLLPTLNKVFSHCLCNQIITFISNEIAFWQRAYLEKRDQEELIFLLKTKIDNFKHLSTKMIVTLIDFTDAFGSASHDFIFECFERFNVPRTCIEIIKDLYRYSNFQVLGPTTLSLVFYIVRGTKTGDPLSVIIFIIFTDCLFKPAVNVVLILQNIQNEMLLNSLPVQGYADDIAIAIHNELTTQKMIHASQPIMCRTNLDIKASKCTVFL